MKDKLKFNMVAQLRLRNLTATMRNSNNNNSHSSNSNNSNITTLMGTRDYSALTPP